MAAEKHKILVVEDEGIVALMMRMNLEKLGYEVCDVVATGEAAITTAARDTPDLVVMDVHLPGRLDGIAAAKEIAAHRWVPFIFFTGYAYSEVAERTNDLHPAAFLTKPVQMYQLVSAIESALAATNDRNGQSGH